MITVPIPPGSCIDPYLLEHRSGADFILADGEYTTRGASVFPDWCSLAPGCRLMGAGSDRTRITLTPGDDPTSSKNPIYYEVLTAGSRTGQSRRVSVTGLLIGAYAPRPAVGLHVWSSDAFVYDVRVDGVWGDPQPSTSWEGFGILVNRAGEAGSNHDGGCIVRQCSVEFGTAKPDGYSARNYATGIYVGIEGRINTPLFESRVEGCRVSSASHTFIADVGYGINSCTVIANCQAWGVERGVFSDTGEGRDSTIERCRFVVGYAGVDFKANNPTWNRVNVRVTDCDFTFRGTANANHVVGLVLDDQSKARNQSVFQRVTVANSRLINGTVGKAYQGSLNAVRSDANGFRGCDWIGSWSPAVISDGVPKTGWKVE